MSRPLRPDLPDGRYHVMNRGIERRALPGRFHSRLITDDAHLLNATRHVHRNPLDLPEVGDIANYRWSSHRTYLGLRAEPEWMRTSDVIVLVWASDLHADRSMLQAAFGFENRHALTAAISRGRCRLQADDELRGALTRAVSLCGGGSRLGSDPWRDGQRAARAAS